MANRTDLFFFFLKQTEPLSLGDSDSERGACPCGVGGGLGEDGSWRGAVLQNKFYPIRNRSVGSPLPPRMAVHFLEHGFSGETFQKLKQKIISKKFLPGEFLTQLWQGHEGSTWELTVGAPCRVLTKMPL